MKEILIAVMMLLAVNASAQKKKSYAYLGPTIYLITSSDADVLYGGTFGFSTFKKQFTLGLAADFLAKKGNGLYLPLYGNLHYFFLNKNKGAFALAQPGYIIRSRSTIGLDYKVTESGGFYFGSGLGFLSSIDGIGITAQLKYVIFNTLIKNEYNGSVSKFNNHLNTIALSVAVAF